MYTIKARRFVPEIERATWPTNEMRIDIDQSKCLRNWSDYVQLDAVALYGYEPYTKMPDELGEPRKLVDEYYVTAPMYDDEADAREYDEYYNDAKLLEGALDKAAVSTRTRTMAASCTTR